MVAGQPVSVYEGCNPLCTRPPGSREMAGVELHIPHNAAQRWQLFQFDQLLANFSALAVVGVPMKRICGAVAVVVSKDVDDSLRKRYLCVVSVESS